MKPAVPFAKAADQTRLRTMSIESSQVPPAGRVMFWSGRKLLGYGDVSRLGDFMAIPKNADTICISASDYPDVREWLG